MAAPPSAYKDRQFLAVIGDEVLPAPPPPLFPKLTLRTTRTQ